MKAKFASLRETRWFSWLWQIALVLVIYLGFQAYQTRSAPEGMMPVIEGQLLSGKKVRLPEDLQGPTLIHFWATWCTVCRLEQGSINALAENANVITIATQSGSADKVARVVSDRNITAPVIVDEFAGIAGQFGVRAFPTSFVVDGEGNIEYTEVGYTTEWGLRFRLWLAAF